MTQEGMRGLISSSVVGMGLLASLDAAVCQSFRLITLTASLTINGRSFSDASFFSPVRIPAK